MSYNHVQDAVAVADSCIIKGSMHKAENIGDKIRPCSTPGRIGNQQV